MEVDGKKVDTPALMPVVNPNLLASGKSISPEELRETFSFQMIITNSYILRKSRELKSRALSEGLHSLLNFQGVIMTDSGTFQSYMYGSGGEVEVDPLEIVGFQREARSDIGTILDRFTVPETDHQNAKKDLEETLSRASKSFDVSGEMELAVPVQGGLHPDLRELSGRSVREMGATYAPIGGVVPLMERYRYPELVDVIVASKRGLGPSIPAHLFGAGHPMIIPLAVALGCDLFDSASYAKFAMDDRYMTPVGTKHLGEVESFPCSCPVCSANDPADILDMDKSSKVNMLARHNLWVLRSVLNEVRGAIGEGTLWEMVERSAMSNPSMYSAVKNLARHSRYLEMNSPRSNRRFTCISDLSLSRPEFKRHDLGLGSRYRIPEGKRPLLFKEWSRSHNPPVKQGIDEAFSKGYWPVIISPVGPVPCDILDSYPLSQSIFPERDFLPPGLRQRYNDGLRWVSEAGSGEPTEWNDELELDFVGEPDNLDALKVANIARMQFGSYDEKFADEMLFGAWRSSIELADKLDLVKSGRTGKVRNVRIRTDGETIHILSLRAEDGLFTLKINGARKLHAQSGENWNRVIVDDETGEFNAKGLNVFNKFVLDAHEGLRPGDEVMVVSESGKLLAVGKAVVSSRAMKEMRTGVAVKVREGIVKG